MTVAGGQTGPVQDIGLLVRHQRIGGEGVDIVSCLPNERGNPPFILSGSLRQSISPEEPSQTYLYVPCL